MSPFVGTVSTTRFDALPAHELWAALRDGAAGSRLDTARAVVRACTVDGAARLGWVCPPPWPVVQRAVARIHAVLGTPGPGGVLVLGTGGWSFAVRALGEVVPPAAQATRVRALDSLAPAAIRCAVLGEGPPPGAYLAVSGSGSTVETRCLAAAVPTLAGAPLVWLRDTAREPDGFALSPRGRRDQVALLGAPLSTAFLAPAALADPAGLAAAYQRLWRTHRELGLAAARSAVTQPVAGTPIVRIAQPGWAGPGLRTWLSQLGRQVLGGKASGYRPRVVVAGGHGAALDLTGFPADLAGLCAAMYTAGVFVTCLGLRAGLRPAEHPNVDAYKRLLDSPPAATPTRAAVADLPVVAARWLAGRPALTDLHVVRYGGAAPLPAAAAFAATTGRRCETHDGTAWNHHSFQAVVADPATAVLVVAAPEPDGSPELGDAARTLRRIALATHACLADRGLLVEPVPEGD
jgi:hypothetical protein